jgi:hypothetical protein
MGARSYTISGLHMAFIVESFTPAEKSSDSKPNTAKISVWNLAEATRQLFTEEHQAIEFYAGYGDNIGLIFSGELTNVIHEKERLDWRTDLYAGDGIKDWTTKYFNRSYPAGSSITQIINDMCDATDLAKSIDIFIDSILLRGESYAGLVKDCLTKITKDRGLQWSVQYGVIEITQRDSPLLRDPSVVVLSADTGLIGQPSLTERTDESKQKDKSEKRRFGVKATSLLNHEIRVNRLVQIQAQTTLSAVGKLQKNKAPNKSANGIYIADTVRHIGDNFGGEFQTEFEGLFQ